MKLENNEIITLSDNKDYAVLKTIQYNENSYIYLMTISKPTQMFLVKEEIIGDEIVLNPVVDKDELNTVISLFEEEN